jgi:hypothetical protein
VSQPTATTADQARPERRPARTPDEIEAEMVATRDRLTTGLATLQNRVSPASLAQVAVDRVLRVVRREDGSLDPVRVSVAAGVVLVLGLYAVRRRRF